MLVYHLSDIITVAGLAVVGFAVGYMSWSNRRRG